MRLLKSESGLDKSFIMGTVSVCYVWVYNIRNNSYVKTLAIQQH